MGGAATNIVIQLPQEEQKEGAQQDNRAFGKNPRKTQGEASQAIHCPLQDGSCVCFLPVAIHDS